MSAAPPWSHEAMPIRVGTGSSRRPGPISAHEAEATERMAVCAAFVMDPFCNHKRCQILLYVEREPGMSIGDLTSLLACSVSVVSQYVGQLERQGWLRVISAGRRRLVHIADPQRQQAIRALRVLIGDLQDQQGAA
ncbi:MAG: MarR family transcriptional regulator [Lysobacter sp.]